MPTGFQRKCAPISGTAHLLSLVVPGAEPFFGVLAKGLKKRLSNLSLSSPAKNDNNDAVLDAFQLVGRPPGQKVYLVASWGADIGDAVTPAFQFDGHRSFQGIALIAAAASIIDRDQAMVNGVRTCADSPCAGAPSSTPSRPGGPGSSPTKPPSSAGVRVAG